MNTLLVDDFADLSGWQPIGSGAVTVQLSAARGRQGPALRMDFDFHGGGGFAVARKAFSLCLPESYVFVFGLRGVGPANIFEFKLVDASNRNVWRHRVESLPLPAAWQEMRISSRQIHFAWGPLGGGPAREIAALEFVIAAGPGGAGTLWLDHLQLIDTSYSLLPRVTASSALPGYPPEHVLDFSPTTAWRSAPTGQPHRLLLDFQVEREYGGLAIYWEPVRRPHHLAVRLSSDGQTWHTVLTTDQGVSPITYAYVPQGGARYVALDLGPEPVGIHYIEVLPYAQTRSCDDFFVTLARRAPRGHYPRYFLGQQSYWTPVGTGDDVTQALFNEEGLVEIDQGECSLEPFLFVDGHLVTWAEAEITPGLERGDLPLPQATWQWKTWRLEIGACAVGPRGASSLLVRYRLTNAVPQTRAVTLFVAIRPFQVTPLWQHWQRFGGMRPIAALHYDGVAVWIDQRKLIIPLSPPSGFGAAAFAQGAITDYLQTGTLPGQSSVCDPFGYASGALRFDLELSAHTVQEVLLAAPFGDRTETAGAPVTARAEKLNGAAAWACARADWAARLDAVTFQVPPQAAEIIATLKIAAAHILINRNGPALQPGPRRYARAWLRDGAVMAAALARLGAVQAGGEFIRWYARFQAPDGNWPDCVDRDGPEWLPEFDAGGEFIFAVMDHYRFGGERAFLVEMWPAVARTVDHLARLRAQRLTPVYEHEDKRACYGLLPESMSHEGYMAHPVHAYWDDFWALRGFKDAAEMAALLGETAAAARIAALRDDFQATLYASLARVIATRGIDFIPGSVEFADFDPTATAVALTIADELPRLPQSALAATFRKYLDGLRTRTHPDADWANYTAYEIRIVGALLRLGWRREAHELLNFLLADQRIRPWHQWPEISWRDPRGPSFIGDLPHSWIGAEYILAARSLFAYEREFDHSLVIAAGVADTWLADGTAVGVSGLPTQYGRLDYQLRRVSDDAYCCTFGGQLRLPSGGLLLMPPLPRPLRGVAIDGRASAAFGTDWARCPVCPAEVLLRY